MGSDSRLRVAVVGSVTWLRAAWLLSRRHDITVYENAARFGGHSNTLIAPVDGEDVPLDTGFIAFNPRTYPNFVELLKMLGVKTQASDRSFAVSLHRGQIEYSGSVSSALFGQPSNLVSPWFPVMSNDAPRDARRRRLRL